MYIPVIVLILIIICAYVLGHLHGHESGHICEKYGGRSNSPWGGDDK